MKNTPFQVKVKHSHCDQNDQKQVAATIQVTSSITRPKVTKAVLGLGYKNTLGQQILLGLGDKNTWLGYTNTW